MKIKYIIILVFLINGNLFAEKEVIEVDDDYVESATSQTYFVYTRNPINNEKIYSLLGRPDETFDNNFELGLHGILYGGSLESTARFAADFGLRVSNWIKPIFKTYINLGCNFNMFDSGLHLLPSLGLMGATSLIEYENYIYYCGGLYYNFNLGIDYKIPVGPGFLWPHGALVVGTNIRYIIPAIQDYSGMEVDENEIFGKSLVFELKIGFESTTKTIMLPYNNED